MMRSYLNSLTGRFWGLGPLCQQMLLSTFITPVQVLKMSCCLLPRERTQEKDMLPGSSIVSAPQSRHALHSAYQPGIVQSEYAYEAMRSIPAFNACNKVFVTA